MLKLILTLMASLTSLHSPDTAKSGGGTGWQSVKGGTVCVWTQQADGRRVYRCEKR